MPTISAHTTLCLTIPASKTTLRGQLGPGHHRLQASAPDQPPSRGLGTVHQGLGYLGIRVCRGPPLRCSLGTDRASASPTVDPRRSAPRPQHLLRGNPGAPMTHRDGCDQHVAPALQGRTTPTTTPPQGSDALPLFARRRIVSTCTVLVLPSTIKGEDLGHLGGTKKNTLEHTHFPAA